MDNFISFNLFNFKSIKSKFIIFIAIICFLVFPDKTFAKEINVSGIYGLVKCTEIAHSSGTQESDFVDCAYVQSNSITGDSTTYTILNKAVRDFSGDYINYNVASRLFLFGSYNFKKDNYYTLNYTFNTGSYVSNFVDLTNISNVKYSYFNSTDYIENQGLKDLSYSQSFDYSTFTGYISITFKATENTSSYRFIIDRLPLFRNTSFDNNQGVRVYLLNALEEEDNTSALLGQITNQNNTMINQNQQIINGQSQGNQKLDDIFNTITDDTPVSDKELNDFFDGIGANFATDTPISDLILMPFTLLEAYSNGISSSCSNFSLGSLFGTELVMPCIDLESIVGSNLWTLIDTLISIFMFYNIAMLCVSIFESITSLDDSFQLLYTPQHGDMSRVGIGHSRGLY